MPVALEPTPDHRDRLIVCGTSCRKSLDILQAFLTSLAWQQLPARTRLHHVFVDDFTPQQSDSRDAIKAFISEHGGELIRGVPGAVGDFSDDGMLPTHAWSDASAKRVGANKNKILRRALELKADAVFLCDRDIILDR